MSYTTTLHSTIFGSRQLPIFAAAIIMVLIISADSRKADAQNLDSIWNMDSARSVPLDVEIVSTDSKDGYKVDELYFTSEMTCNGPNRIFCVFARPEKPLQPIPAAIAIHGGGGHADANTAIWIAKTVGCASLSIDWSGEYIPGAKRYTLWRGENPNPYQAHFLADPNVKSSSIYHIVIAVRRALDFLSEQPNIDMSRVACWGGSWGGFLSNLVSGVDNRVKYTCCALGAGGFKKTSRSKIAEGVNKLPQNRREQWIRAFDPISYAANADTTTFQYACANDYFFWLGDVQDNYLTQSGKKRLLIRPNSNHDIGGPDKPDFLVSWLRHCFYNEESFPSIIEGSFKAEDSIYRWKCAPEVPVQRAVLYWSPGLVTWPGRYWLAIPAVKNGDEWCAKLPEKHSKLAAMVYVTIYASETRAVSGTVSYRSGVDPAVKPCPLWAQGCIWDRERGIDAWRPTGPAESEGPPGVKMYVTPNGSLSIAPADNEKRFGVLTNSVVLAGGHAASYAGIQISLDGNGQTGKLTITLQRDSGSTKEMTFSAEVPHSDGATMIDIPWKNFNGADSASPYPFDGFRLDGERADGSPILLESVEFLDK